MRLETVKSKIRFLDAEIKVHPSWKAFFTLTVRAELKNIEDKLRPTYRKNKLTPPPKKMLRFFQNDLKNVKLIIIGQEPYPQPGVATGRAFEVGNIRSWEDKFPQVSLKNIIRAVYAACSQEYHIRKNGEKTELRFTRIREEIKRGTFRILPPPALFDHWEKQGVLLLNVTCSCEINKPGSHEGIWHSFALQLLNLLSRKKTITWLIWGKEAWFLTKEFNLPNSYEAPHPGRAFADDHPFYKDNHFAKTKHIIDWTGYGC